MNETSQDAGGISREFFTQVTKEILSEGIGLFTKANTDEFSYVVSPTSYEISEYQMLFRFFGKLMGKALFDRIPVNLCLNKQVYLALLRKTSVDDYHELEDFRHQDTAVYNSLKFFRDNDLTQFVDVVEQHFEHSTEEGKSVELVPGGAFKRVNNSNKLEFIKLKCHYIGYKQCKSQLDALVDGFNSIVPY